MNSALSKESFAKLTLKVHFLHFVFMSTTNYSELFGID